MTLTSDLAPCRRTFFRVAQSVLEIEHMLVQRLHLIEIIFALDGLGLLGFEAVLNRDYPIVFATLYVFGLMGLMIKLVTDVTYVLVDPRIDFESREV